MCVYDPHKSSPSYAPAASQRTSGLSVVLRLNRGQ